jgi:hypothetical protein
MLYFEHIINNGIEKIAGVMIVTPSSSLIDKVNLRFSDWPCFLVFIVDNTYSRNFPA